MGSQGRGPREVAEGRDQLEEAVNEEPTERLGTWNSSSGCPGAQKPGVVQSYDHGSLAPPAGPTRCVPGVLVTQWCLTLWDPMDCSLPAPLSMEFSRQILYQLSHWGSPCTWKIPGRAQKALPLQQLPNPAPTPARFLHFPSGHRLGRLFNLLLPGHGTTEDEGSSEWRSLPDSGNWLTLDGSAGAGSGPARESGREEGSQRPHRPRARPPATETSPGAPNPPSQHALSHFPEDGSGFLHDRHKSARPLEPRPRLPSQ
ncbi:uncharacterized protein LOC122695370 [Cervus elaphus]|uniref:uncharacterized protein LOC122438667 n=1 Tax=Cervus canadensis TaxID=1574408 RepID=UPI001C9E6351|nr:uncharacterized protein LOC122438667 [Cervus canadensis]XP_043761099.1 uncharacterized protein LOC122695370 [Cervus elaphus]